MFQNESTFYLQISRFLLHNTVLPLTEVIRTVILVITSFLHWGIVGTYWVRFSAIVREKPKARGYNWATLFLEEINTGTWLSRFGDSQK
jgi:cytochrome b